MDFLPAVYKAFGPLYTGGKRTGKGKRKKMKITIVTVGKIKEKYLRDAIEEYTKRLSKYCKLEIIQVADEKTP